jgi:5-formyltetrahydrofolate cyclo-ligase
MPLVAFDEQGNRLGMGGGFYDRTLAYLRQREQWRRPLLIGLAHECQKVPSLESQRWDIPLDAIFTEAAVYSWQLPPQANRR